jgi:hypothetical protein
LPCGRVSCRIALLTLQQSRTTRAIHCD